MICWEVCTLKIPATFFEYTITDRICLHSGVDTGSKSAEAPCGVPVDGRGETFPWEQACLLAVAPNIPFF